MDNNHSRFSYEHNWAQREKKTSLEPPMTYVHLNPVPILEITICIIHNSYRDETIPISLQHPKVSMELDMPIIELHTLECMGLH
jgi:hypothetical protein